ncbi:MULTISPECIES: helix-turn-helix transcriptional regulator [unclassified Bradyrhizobium]|uniref:helix-turn-helix transcriptional regulator n=1 Tax=Bradyrhizobium sp. USDA 4541 TaxID=2817704 RepID=UPI0020A4C5BD|nr:helix-turn-helix domain-containing protein [Bradyrhizobium sp. USDA 4541]MCP1852102.1 hypothetical protein [Bradyrhizobium sp. USDA 4541]
MSDSSRIDRTDETFRTSRLMTGAQAAAYLGITTVTLAKWVAAGIVPPPLPGTRRWDRKAIDLALDKASGIAVPPSITSEEDEYTKWKQGYEARNSAAEQEWLRNYEARKAARKPPRT